MDLKQRKSILAHLTQKSETDPIALQAIQKEFVKINDALQSETQYENINDQLELLGVIAYRIDEKTVSTIRLLLNSLISRELTYQEIFRFSTERLSKYQNNYTLMKKALEVLDCIRYYQPSEILDILFEYSDHEEENVSKQAKHGIKQLATYNLDVFSSCGYSPQEKVLEKISSFNETQKCNYFSTIIVACEQILSPTISGTSSTYKTVTWRTGAIPAMDGVKQIRKKAIEELQNLFTLAEDFRQKKRVLNAMNEATRTPDRGRYGDDVLAMILENTIAVVEFMKSIVIVDDTQLIRRADDTQLIRRADDMQLMQKIEHDTYWLFFHKSALDTTIRKTALKIRDTLYANEEYQKFRILIGFESIFYDWEKGLREDRNFDRGREIREAEALKLAEHINSDSYLEWKERITCYASIKSDDMATFSYFAKFLGHFGKTSPAVAMQLLLEASDQLENFIVAIFYGIAATEHKGDVYSLIDDWCNEGKYLFSLARFFEYSPEVKEELLKKILDKAEANNDLNTLNQIISSISAQYNKENKHLIKSFFVPAIKKLTTHKNSSWIFGFWFRNQRVDILDDMETTEHKAILDNLLWLQEIDYHSEEILCVIAKQSPELVIQFFCNRLSKEKDDGYKSKYTAIPFSFHKLSEPLSQHPVQAVDIILDIYDANDSLFIYLGARLLKNIFPNFPLKFQQKLLDVIQSKEKKYLLSVMAILRNYDGNPIIHNVCKEIVRTLPDSSSDLTNELSLILQSTGVVNGEYGFLEAYNQKIEEIRSWLHDENSRVKEFAQNYIESLEKSIEYEKKRVEEDIILRQHQYGVDED